ncbi:NACHT domain-containing protein [Kovacikia minuta CCNUW1]|uniref:NB-ARC domain-containing protein n=1 Tax=Kovacikia minuta TaxID=2931930 RepID=UPI001CCB5E17|nr:NB-ARC domain-containing protein [Kovacikia minuta]UBF29341.1 NACHT domain-containing protein [Kovacikia minuta CCNUW1]
MNVGQSKRRRGVILTSQGWKKLREAIREVEYRESSGARFTQAELAYRTQLDEGTVARVLQRQVKVSKGTLEQFYEVFDLELEEDDYSRPPVNDEDEVPTIEGTAEADRTERVSIVPVIKFPTQVDWGEAVDVPIFYGRLEELATLERWLMHDRCRLIALLGMGGIGKTALAVKLGEQIKEEFEYVVWRSLRNAPLIEDVLTGIIQFLSNRQEIDLSKSLDALISSLMYYLSQHRCLLILDNAESILRGGDRTGQYREGFEGYGELIRRVGELHHLSCLLLTSREKPKEISLLEGRIRPVRSCQLEGLSQTDGQKILQVEGAFGTKVEQRQLINRYSGNPLAVRIAATTVQTLFSGNISIFLEQGAAVFGDIRDLLDQQFNRLSELDKATMRWLAINREPVSLKELREDFVLPITPQKLLETLESLERRSLIEKALCDNMDETPDHFQITV